MSRANFNQAVHVEVVKNKTHNPRSDYLKEPVLCENCGNKRRWLIRCEYCGVFTKIKEKSNGHES